MRTSLFLSTLFAVTLVGGAALAEKPHEGQGREPRVVEQIRAHGDIVDKSYSSPERSSRTADRSAGASATTRTRTAQTKNPLDRSASRVNCSDTGSDCSAKGGGAAHAATAESSSSASNRVARTPAFLDKILGSDRTNFNDADMDEGMSTRAANRAWERAGAAHHGGGASHGDGSSAASLAAQKQVAREDEQYSGTRVSCNEGDQCSASSKATKKEWAYAAVRAGTWQPELPSPTPAAVRIHEYRAAEGRAIPQGSKGNHEGGASADHEDPH